MYVDSAEDSRSCL